MGIIVLLALLSLSWRRVGRRVTLYLFTLQILLGLLAIAQGWHPPLAHWLCAVLGWVLLMAANGIERRHPDSTLPVWLAVVAILLTGAAYGIGEHAARVGMLTDNFLYGEWVCV